MQIYIGGSRHFQSSPGPASLIQSALATGRPVHVGCCVGADQAVIQAAIRSSSFQQVRAFAAFGPGGEGAIPTLSAVKAVRAFAQAGGPVSWWAGGGLELPLAARLIQRSQAALKGSSVAIFIEPGEGSFTVAGLAVAAGIEVLVFNPGIPGKISGHAGQWQMASFLGTAVWRWWPAQQSFL
jgi:hypothetical protein